MLGAVPPLFHGAVPKYKENSIIPFAFPVTGSAI
jgi:hypothetical protein